MASAEFQFDTRIRRYHVPLKTQQRRLRHLRSIAARNVIPQSKKHSDKVGLYYTLHHVPNSSPFYKSEIISDNLNPTWKDFEPSNFPGSVMLSSPHLTVRMWHSVKEQLLVEWVVFFTGLSFLGKQIPKEGTTFKPNTLVFGMLEGYYSCSSCQEKLQAKANSAHKDSISNDISALRTSCAFSTLGRIRTFERVISQIQCTASKWKKNIETKLQEAEKLHQVHSSQEMLTIRTSMLQVEVQQQQFYLMALEKHVSSVQEKLAKDQSVLKNMCDDLKANKDKLVGMWHNFWEFRENLLKIEAQLLFRRKELVSDLFSIYPVIQFPDQKGYSIHNVHLPNSENLYGHDERMIAVALGYVCHVLLMISQFLNVPLRYEVDFNGSRSSVLDHISSTIPVKDRRFPLYTKGKDKRYFEYAVYLLNKNIAQLRILFGLTSKELSATLPNLHNLIEQRLSFTNESGLSSPGNAVGLHDEKEMLVLQNGLSQVPNSSGIGTRQTVPNADIEHLRKEIAEMLPANMGKSESNNLVSRWTKDITNTFSGSLDKGLDDIKVREMSHDLTFKLQEMPPLKHIAEGVHHSSYPNLNSCVQTLEKDPLSSTVSVSSQLQSSPLKMWVGGSSYTNSEEEPIEEISEPKKAVAEAEITNFQTYVSKDWTTAEDTRDASNLDPGSISLQSAMLEKHDFGEDLTLRAEQLARRSSSFQMQKMNSLNNDTMKAHPS